MMAARVFDVKKIVEGQLSTLLKLVENIFQSSSTCQIDDLKCIVDVFEQLVEAKALPVSLEVDEDADFEAEKKDFCEGNLGEITFWLRVSKLGLAQKSFWLLLMSIVSAFFNELLALGSTLAVSCTLKNNQLGGVFFLLLQMFVLFNVHFEVTESSKGYYADQLKALIKKVLPVDVEMKDPVLEEDGNVLRITLVRDRMVDEMLGDELPSLQGRTVLKM